MYNEEIMNFDNMKQLIGMAAFSIMMCIVAMFVMNGCTRPNNDYMDSDSIYVDSLDTVLVDSLDTIDYQGYPMGLHIDSVVYGEK
jgi:hypothetical protein